MSARARLLAAALLLAGCAAPGPPPDTAQLPPGAMGAGNDPDVQAIDLAAYAFADPARTYGKPEQAARAVAAVEYLGGELSTSPRWAMIDGQTRSDMLAARAALRAALGVPATAPSQAVVDGLLAAAKALSEGDVAGAEAALHPPVFTEGGVGTMRHLSNLPYIQVANLATRTAASEAANPGGSPQQLCVLCN